MSVADAAHELGLTEQHVRRLIRAGALPSRRLGRVWLVDAAGVQARARLEAPPGRPVAPPLAWAILRVTQAAIDANDSSERSTTQVSRRAIDAAIRDVPDRQLRYRLRRQLATAPHVSAWPQWLRNRAVPHPIWVHPGVIDRLTADDRVRGSETNLRRSAGEPVLYVDEADLDPILATYHARRDPIGPVRLMVIPGDLPERLIPEKGKPLPSAVSLLELLDHPDARPRHQATELLSVARRLMCRSVQRRGSVRASAAS